MKRFLTCLLAVSLLAFVSCKKDDVNEEQPRQTDYAADFLGTYDVSINASMTLPILGETPIPLPEMEATCVRNGDGNEVILTMSNRTIDGYANASGLHVDPFLAQQSIAGYDLSITVTVPVVAAPTDGVISGTASLSASVAGVAIPGSAEFTAVKR